MNKFKIGDRVTNTEILYHKGYIDVGVVDYVITLIDEVGWCCSSSRNGWHYSKLEYYEVFHSPLYKIMNEVENE